MTKTPSAKKKTPKAKTSSIGHHKVDHEPARIKKILAGLEAMYPDAHVELDFKTPLQLLLATIMSAQTTDVRVNMVTPALFERYPTAKALANADPAALEEMIRSTGFYRMKAKNIRETAHIIAEKYAGKVPESMDDLVALPGVARKTANVVLGSAFGKPSGVVVDTHVKRLSNRLALTASDEPEQIEQDLMQAIPKSKWIDFSHQMIWHGRRVCFAAKPKCNECKLAEVCPSAFKV